MLNSPKIAVLLATYNGAQYLSKQLESLFIQSEVSIDIYVSDDDSDDDTPAILKSSTVSNKNVYIMPPKKLGSAAGNFFRLIRDVDLHTYEYVALSDQDDIWDINKLSEAVKKMTSQSGDAYSGNVEAFWENGRKKIINKAQKQKDYDYMFESAGPGCTFVLRAKLAIELQSFLISNIEKCSSIALHDWFIYAFTRNKGYKWIIDSKSYMQYRQHSTNVVGANSGFKAKLVRWKMLKNGWLRAQALCIADSIGYSHKWPIQRFKRFSLKDRLYLISKVSYFRRRLRDQFALIIFLILAKNENFS